MNQGFLNELFAIKGKATSSDKQNQPNEEPPS